MCNNLIGKLFNSKEKMNDDVNARLDLIEMKIRELATREVGKHT